MQHFVFDMIGGLLGIAIHIFAVKLPGHKKKCKAGNIVFSASSYLKEDWMAIVAAVLTVFAASYALDEAIHAYPLLENYVKFFMLFIGFTGSSIFIAIMGKATDTALKVIDVKTNKADGIE